MSITTNDLLDAIREALSAVPDGEGQTVQEMAEATGLGTTTVRKTLAALHRDGRLTVVRVRRPALDGRLSSVPAYRLRGAM